MKAAMLHDMSWLEVDRLQRSKTTMILPIASTEQHGYHLPVSTDTLIAQGIIKGLLDCQRDYKRNYVILPVLPLGLSPEHLAFAGSLSIQSATAAAILRDVIGSLSRQGFRDYIICNTHGGNTPFLQCVARELRMELQCTLRLQDLYGKLFYQNTWKQLEGTSIDIHGGEYETSVLMYLYPGQVRKGFAPEQLRTDLSSLPGAWFTQELSATGVIGDATLASATKGKTFFEHAVISLCQLLDQHQPAQS